MGLFGKMKKKAQEMAGKQEAAPPAQAAAPDEDVDDGDDDDDDDDDGYSITNSDWYEKHMRAGNTNHFGNLDPNDLDNFYFHYFELEEAEMNDELDEKLSEFGVADKDEWGKIWASFNAKHFGGLSEQEFQDKSLQTMMNARQRQQMNKMSAAAAADPSLTEPFEGVTVEGWAQAAAGIGSCGGDVNVMNAKLAELGMDKAKYDRVDAEFQARMQRDTSFVIAGIYGKAFSGAQGMAGGYGLGNTDGSAQQLGDEPCTYEEYCEITGAQAAWGQSGQDVNAKLKEVFGIDAMEISRLGGYWSTKFQTDAPLMLKYGDDMERAKQKYMGGGHDDDLSI
jgi:hypothetical protein